MNDIHTIWSSMKENMRSNTKAAVLNNIDEMKGKHKCKSFFEEQVAYDHQENMQQEIETLKSENHFYLIIN